MRQVGSPHLIVDQKSNESTLNHSKEANLIEGDSDHEQMEQSAEAC